MRCRDDPRPAGRRAFNSLRLEKGYRLSGTDMTTEHDPYAAGLGFAVKADKDFIGRAALSALPQPGGSRLTVLTLDDPTAVVLGKEPVYAGDTPAGYVTSAAYGYTIGRCVAYAWLPATLAPGAAMTIDYLGTRLAATVGTEPLVDPGMTRIRDKRCSMPSYDVIVLGLGGMGSAAAHRLAARGQRVLGLEQFGPAHALGSSHGGSRIIRQSYFEDPAYVPLLVRAYELWADLERATGADLLTLTGGLYLGPVESTTVAGSLAAATEWDLPHEYLDAAAIRERFPTLNPDADTVGLFEERAGFVRPEASVAAQLEVAAQRGADLHFEEPAVSWSANAEGVAVTTARGTYTAGQLVIAPGAWAPRVLADLGLPLRIERQVQYWFQPVGGVDPYLPERHPIYIWEDTAGSQIYGFPSVDGPDGGAKIAFFRRGADADPDHLDREIRPGEIAVMAERAGRDLPTLPGTFLRGAACMYTTTPDEHFVIATHPKHDRVTIACGFSGHGFKFVPVVGEILADLAIDRTTRHPIGLFDPARAFGVGSLT